MWTKIPARALENAQFKGRTPQQQHGTGVTEMRTRIRDTTQEWGGMYGRSGEKGNVERGAQAKKNGKEDTNFCKLGLTGTALPLPAPQLVKLVGRLRAFLDVNAQPFQTLIETVSTRGTCSLGRRGCQPWALHE